MFTDDRLNQGLSASFLEFARERTAKKINDYNKKIRFLKKHNTFSYYTIKNFLAYDFYKVFYVELSSNLKIRSLYNLIINVKDNKHDKKEYIGYVQSILADLSKAVEEFHIYAAILRRYNFTRIKPNFDRDEFIRIFERKYTSDLFEYDKGSETLNLQYKNLRKHFNSLVDHVLGKGYYNEGSDVYSCDELTCRDLKNAFKIKR